MGKSKARRSPSGEAQRGDRLGQSPSLPRPPPRRKRKAATGLDWLSQLLPDPPPEMVNAAGIVLLGTFAVVAAGLLYNASSVLLPWHAAIAEVHDALCPVALGCSAEEALGVLHQHGGRLADGALGADIRKRRARDVSSIVWVPPMHAALDLYIDELRPKGREVALELIDDLTFGGASLDAFGPDEIGTPLDRAVSAREFALAGRLLLLGADASSSSPELIRRIVLSLQDTVPLAGMLMVADETILRHRLAAAAIGGGGGADADADADDGTMAQVKNAANLLPASPQGGAQQQQQQQQRAAPLSRTRRGGEPIDLQTTDGTRQLLSLLLHDPNSNYKLIAPEDAYTHSETWRSIVARLGELDETGGLRVADVITVLDELAARMLADVLASGRHALPTELRARVPGAPSGRNMLHCLAVSGGARTLRAVLEHLDAAKGAISDAAHDSGAADVRSEEVRAALAEALDARDDRGFTPFELAAMVFGNATGDGFATDLTAVFADAHGAAGVGYDAERLDALFEVTRPSTNRRFDGDAQLRAAAVLEAQLDSGGWDKNSTWDGLVPTPGDDDGAEAAAGGKGPPQQGQCDIEEVWTAPEADAFFERYMSEQRPVVFRGAALDWKFRESFARDEFIGRYGQYSVVLAPGGGGGVSGALDGSGGGGGNLKPVSEVADYANQQCPAGAESASPFNGYATSRQPGWSALSADAPTPSFLDKAGGELRSLQVSRAWQSSAVPVAEVSSPAPPRPAPPRPALPHLPPPPLCSSSSARPAPARPCTCRAPSR